MYSYLFTNKGVIDKTAITTFGVSSKENNNPIGFFGTGLKYAIAVLLRNRCNITIFAGMEKLEFSTEQVKVRKDAFELISMNGVRLGFTTELGKTWHIWQAFRELACNTIDEGGSYQRLIADSKSFEVSPDTTHIVVSGSPFETAWSQRDSIILKPGSNNRINTEENQEIEVFNASSEFLYYRGVRVMDVEKPTLYTYNFQRTMDLTEDRTFKHSWVVSSHLSKLVESSSDAEFVRRILTAPPSSFEHDLHFGGLAIEDTFKKVVLDCNKKAIKINRSALSCVRERHFDELGSGNLLTLSEVDKQRLKKAIDFLKKMNFSSIEEYPIIPVEDLGEGVLGRAHNHKIYISRASFELGTKILAGTLLEEWIHLKHRLADETRGMQNYLLNALITAGENATGELL